MGALIATDNPVRYLKKEAERNASTAAASQLVSSLMTCILWLMKAGIPIIGFRGFRGASGDRIVIDVAASPYLYSLFHGEFAWYKRRQEGALTYFSYFADRFGVRVEWEEVRACH